MQYQLYLKLRQRAASKIAISFWERKEIKDKVIEFYESCKKFEIIELLDGKIKWDKFIETVVDEWNKDVLPKNLEDELIDIVKMIGERIFNWYRHIDNEYGEKEKAITFIDEIKWTPYGTVDEVEIFKSSWLDNPNHDITKVYNFACRYAITDHIDDLWNKIPSDIQDDCYKDIYGRFDQHILAYWKHRRNNNLPNLMGYFRVSANDFYEEDQFNLIYDQNRSVEENMLRLSAHQGYFNATKYFWAKLTEEERHESVLKCARITVLCYFYKFNREGYYNSQCVEICIFLMNQMSNRHKKAFFNEELGLNCSGFSYRLPSDIIDAKDKILEMLLSTWPWQRLFIPVLKDMIQHQDDNSRMPCMFLDAITCKMIQDGKMSKYRCLLRAAWLIVPAFIKQKMVHYSCTRNFIWQLVVVCDWDSLAMILNDPEIAAVRDKVIDYGLYSFTDLMQNCHFDQLNEVLKVISRSEKEKEWFKLKIKVQHHRIFGNMWDMLPPEELPPTGYIYSDFDFRKDLIDMDDYKLADKFLDWRFNTEEERKKFKDNFKNDSFSIMQIFDIWANSQKDINSAKDKCSRFLHWFLESEEQIELFKNGISVNLDSDPSIINDIILLKRDGILGDFMSWCLPNDEVFQRIIQIIDQLNL